MRPGGLLAVDWVSRAGELTEVVAFVFDGGTIGAAAADLTLPAEEIGSARFATLADAEELMDAEAHSRVARALEARHHGRTAHLEDGQGPDISS